MTKCIDSEADEGMTVNSCYVRLHTGYMQFILQCSSLCLIKQLPIFKAKHNMAGALIFKLTCTVTVTTHPVVFYSVLNYSRNNNKKTKL